MTVFGLLAFILRLLTKGELMKRIKEERLKFTIPGNKHIVFEVKTSKGIVPRHWHNYFELEIIIGGKGRETICGKECDIFPGCGYLLSMEDYHSVNTEEELEILHLSFDEHFIKKEQLEKILMNKGLPYFVLTGSNFEIIKSLFLVAKAENDAFGEKSICLKTMVECLVEKILDSFPKENGAVADRVSVTMRDAVLYIHTHFQKPITLNEVALVANYNSSYFSTAFKTEFGVTFSEYLTKLRVDYAKRLLISTDEVVNEIGKRSGFFSPSAFLQSFKKYENITPTAYRKNNS